MLGYISSGLAESSIILPLLLKRHFRQIMFKEKRILKLPFNADRVVDLVPLCCLVIILQWNVEAGLFRHLKTNLTKCREVKLAKLKILYLLRIWQ